jgi:tetratricopeptide (TPR) repeat protein
MGPVAASERSSALIDEGLNALQQSEWNDALRDFIAASVADPEDNEALFFQGVALNRLALHVEALAQIESARAAGVQNAAMDFEYGWALLGAGRFQDALASLQSYKDANPDSAKASELIGRAQFTLGNSAAGQKAFDEALQLDSSLKSSIAFFRAGLAQAQGKDIEGEELLDSAAGADQTGAVSRAVRQHLDLLNAIQSQRSTKPWTVFGTAAVGRDTNVIALSDQIARPSDITRQASAYANLTAGGQYRFDINNKQNVTIGGVFNHREYRDISDIDTDTVNTFARYEHTVTRRLRASVSGGFTHIRVNRIKKQNTVNIGPSLRYLINDRVRLDAAYSFTKINLPDPSATPENLDRDSGLQNIGGTITIAFPRLRTNVTFGGAYLQNSAVGSDYDYRGRQVKLAVRTQLPWDMTGGVSINRTAYDYLNLNSLAPTTPAGPTAFGFARQDTITSISANLSRPINDRFSVYARVTRTNAVSNLAVFQYDQKDMQIGVTTRF